MKQEFDVIWAEGSIFILGLEKGISYWKQFLKDGGYMALTGEHMVHRRTF
ncbi:MAG: hypothetical protein R2741_07905 [Methanolobus sp.]